MMLGLDVNQDRASWERFAFGLVQAYSDIRQIAGPQGSESGITGSVRQAGGRTLDAGHLRNWHRPVFHCGIAR